MGSRYEEGLQEQYSGRYKVLRHSDFTAQESVLYEAVDHYRHMVDFLPKFHCELAPIENFWSITKSYARAYFDYLIAGLRRVVSKALDNIQVSSICKYFRRSMHLIQTYREGCGYKLAMFAQKKYKYYRRLPEGRL